MQPVGQLDEDDTDIVRHRQHHLAEILRLFFFIAPKRDLADLGHPVDQMHDVLPELPFEFVRRGDRIFQRIVQQPATMAVTSVLSEVRLRQRR